MQNNNPITEIILGVLAALFIAGAVFLLYVGKVDFAGASLMFGFPAALFGINQALKTPSASQQAQLGVLLSQHQALTSQVLSVLPAVVAPQVPASQPVQAQAPAATPWQAQQFKAGNTFAPPTVPMG